MHLQDSFILVLVLRLRICLIEYSRMKYSAVCNMSKLNFILSATKIFGHRYKQANKVKKYFVCITECICNVVFENTAVLGK